MIRYGLIGPIFMQTRVSRVRRDTRATGAVTVLVIPHPADCAPVVTTCEPDSTTTLTLGPALAINGKRIATVPCGIVPPYTQTFASPEINVESFGGGMVFVPATTSGDPESTPHTAITTRVDPITRVTLARRSAEALIGPDELLTMHRTLSPWIYANAHFLDRGAIIWNRRDVVLEIGCPRANGPSTHHS